MAGTLLHILVRNQDIITSRGLKCWLCIDGILSLLMKFVVLFVILFTMQHSSDEKKKSVVGYQNSIILHIHKLEFCTCLWLLLYSYVWHWLPVFLLCDLNCKHLWLNEACINGVVFFPPSLSARTSMLQLNNLANQHELQLLWVFLFCFCLLLFIAPLLLFIFWSLGQPLSRPHMHDVPYNLFSFASIYQIT